MMPASILFEWNVFSEKRIVQGKYFLFSSDLNLCDYFVYETENSSQRGDLKTWMTLKETQERNLTLYQKKDFMGVSINRKLAGISDMNVKRNILKTFHLFFSSVSVNTF